jgi:hypothetical protein
MLQDPAPEEIHTHHTLKLGEPLSKTTQAQLCHIPPDYSLKYWDPTNKPIMLFGSVFDANSLGKWIYGWTIWYHGLNTPMADIAHGLWLLLSQFNYK